jgi:hypothetical protein
MPQYLDNIKVLWDISPINVNGQRVTKEALVQLYSTILRDRMTRSILWMYLRCVPEPPFSTEAEDCLLDGFLKEFEHSRDTWSKTQLFSYDGFFQTPLYPEYPLSPHWVSYVDGFIPYLRQRIQSIGLVYPQVNRTKNVSRETGLNLARLTDMDPAKVTTRDLEVFHATTGEKIRGSCEVRAAWRYNVLKPRTYYAQGGDSYFASRYMKKIAVAFMESLPGSKMKSRTDVSSFLTPESFDSRYWTLWDLTSFTTNLSELKFFLYWITRALEEQSGPIFLTVLDYADGIVEHNLIDLLDDYNEQINLHPVFSIHRILDRLNLEAEVDESVQMNNGMLGVPGNIGFSTTLHTAVSSSISGPHQTVCVGDDATAFTDNSPDEYLIPTIQVLGEIQFEKFDRFPPRPQLNTQCAKFLKRAWRRSEWGLELDFNFPFPITPLMDEWRDPDRTLLKSEWFDRLNTLLAQTGALLWKIFENADQVANFEWSLVKKYLKASYDVFQLPISGSLPGFHLKHTREGSHTIYQIIPPLNFDPRIEDWIEVLALKDPEQEFALPIFYEKAVHLPMMDLGDTDFCTENMVLKVLEDLGCVSIKVVRQSFQVMNATSKMALNQMLKREKGHKLVEVVCTKRFPEWYEEDIQRFFYGLDVQY